jgi:hypothetical protein
VSGRARKYPVDPIPEDRSPADYSQSPWEGEGSDRDNHKVAPSAGRQSSLHRPHSRHHDHLELDPYQDTSVSGFKEGEGRMVCTRRQLGNPNPHVFTPGVPTLPTPPPPFVEGGGYPPAPGGRAPRYKDLRYDGKSSWKSFLHKFVTLARSQRWSETEQHDQFCFSLEGTASDYYTLLLDTDPRIAFAEILRRFHKRFRSSAPDLTHQLNFPVRLAKCRGVVATMGRSRFDPSYPNLPRSA